MKKNCIMVIIVMLKKKPVVKMKMSAAAAAVGMIKMMSKLIGSKTDSKLVIAYYQQTVKHYI